jgi:hypothetical protein
VPRRSFAFAAMASVMVIAIGCSGSTPSSSGVLSSASEPATASPASSAGAPGTDLEGTYTATIPSGVNAAPGTWRLSMAAGGWMFTHPDGNTFSPGSVVEITADEVVLAADPGCPGQAGTATEGSYRWSIEGTSLTFELVSDSCRDRIDTLTSSEWSLSQ